MIVADAAGGSRLGGLAAAALPRSGAPVRPDAGTARDLARRELAKAVYADARPGLLERLLNALGSLLDRLGVPGASSPWRLVALLAVLAAVAAVVVLLARATGRASRRAGGDAAGLATARSAADLRAAADAAAAAGDFDLAVTERFRALVRALQARDLVTASPGLTAGEAGGQAAAALPDLAERVRAASALFDAVVYGGASAGAADDAALAALDTAAAAAVPVHDRAAAGAAR